MKAHRYPMGIGLAVVMIGAPAWAADPAPRSAGLDCQVLEAVAPGEIEAVHASEPAAGAGLASDLPHAAKSLGLSDGEVASVQARARSLAAPYRPTCWGPLIPPPFNDLRRRVSFTRPIFITAEVAVVQMWRDQYDRGGAWICVARRQGATWRATCHQTMVWAR